MRLSFTLGAPVSARIGGLRGLIATPSPTPVPTPTPTPIPTIPTIPPADWRMPASVATSSGLAGSQSALAAASSGAASKSRPSVSIASGASEWIEWTAGESGDALLSFIPRSATGSFAIALDGAAQPFAKAIPEGTNEDARRQAIRLPVTAGQVLRLSVTATGGACAIEPLLHLVPATGPWDAHLIFGPSLLQTGYQSSAMENAILAAFPARDPVCFNYARTSYTAAQLAAISDEAVVHFGTAARYAWCGGLVVNDTGNDAPSAAEIASLTASLTTIFDNLAGAGLSVGMGSTRYLAYSGTGAPGDQSTGSRAYDSAVVTPFIQSRSPALMEPATGRPRYDEYLLDLFRRDLHSDYVHGTSAQYALERAEIVKIWHGFLYTGAWGGYVPQIEQRIAGLEAASTDEATALTALTEAGYALLALDAGAPKDSYQTRYDAAEPVAMFSEAKRLIAIAELSTAPADKVIAQNALDGADVAGFAGATAPDTLAAQQARIDAIASAAFDQIIQVAVGDANPGASGPGWNAFAPAQTTTPVAGQALIDATGAATAVQLVLEYVVSPSNSSGGNATGSQISEIPDPRLRTRIVTSNGNGVQTRLTGLDDARVYDLVAAGAGSNQFSRFTKLIVNGVDYATKGESDNLGNPWRVNGIAPVGGAIDIDWLRGAGSTYTYAAPFVLKRRA